MADTRINLLSTATSSIGDDFLPIDGNTNGTRKLSAFSPSFGGNATVGGTLTVNGASASIVGTAFFGASSDVQASRAGAGVLDVRHPSNTTSRIDVQGATSAGLGLRQSGTRDWFVSAESTELRTSCLTANSVASYESGVLVRVRDTTASLNTSSGALVVSGGVGVAGAIYAGGLLNVASTAVSSIAGGLSMGASGTNNGYITINGAAGGLRSYLVQTAGVIRWRVGADNTAESGSNAGSDFHIFSYTDAGAGIGEAFKITRANSAAAFAGSITTGAPAGGTAAAWKLGTVATVSPTSPNRTIEVDIGGTIYYIHAKTTNN